MLRNYPTQKTSSAPATGSLFYQFLLENIKVPASANHTIWYEGEEKKLDKPDDYPFRGDMPKPGTKLELKTVAGKSLDELAHRSNITKDDDGIFSLIVNGDESQVFGFDENPVYILVSDLSDNQKEKLNIPGNAKNTDKVFNGNFKPYDQLAQVTKVSNELAGFSVAKSISSYLGGVNGKVNYSERDVLNLLDASVSDLSGNEMMHFLHGNHLAWSALAYNSSNGDITSDISAEFHGQNPTDFYIKDLGTMLPTMFFAVASLGEDPVKYHDKLDVEVWGAKDAAVYMQQFMEK